MTKKLIVGNWKMNPGTVAEARRIAGKVKRAAVRLEHTEAVVCPPFPYILPCVPRRPVGNFCVGAQTVSAEAGGGPHTGEVGAAMLKDLGVSYVIVGHSEQRAMGDTGVTVGKKVKNVLEAGLTPIVCVGESARDPEGAYLENLKGQIKECLGDMPKKYGREIIIAYEPVWAIGAKEAMAPEQIYEMSLFVKKVLADIFTPEAGVKTTVLYGGSVNFRNAPDIMRVGKVDGLLVGRESVNVSGFVELLKAVDQI